MERVEHGKRCDRCHRKAPNPEGCARCNPEHLGSRLRHALTEIRKLKLEAQGVAEQRHEEWREWRDDLADAEAHLRDVQRELQAANEALAAARASEAAAVEALRVANLERQQDHDTFMARINGLEDDTATLAAALTEANATARTLNERALLAIDARPSVRRFAAAMEAQLRKNDHKGESGWLHERYSDLLPRVDQELAELRREIVKLAKVGDGDATNTLERVVKESADVANFAMFIADLAYKGDRE